MEKMWNRKIMSVMMGLLSACVVTLLGILILAFCLYQWKISVDAARIGSIVLYFLSCLVGGMVAGKKAQSRKFLWGLLLGGCYFVILIFFSLTGGEKMVSEGKNVLLPGVICLFSGMLGGMLVH